MRFDQIKIALQYLVPQHLLSRAVGRLLQCQWPWFKDQLIGWYIRHFQVDMSTSAEADPRAFVDFNHFFTRALKPEARSIVTGEDTVACPADGCISQMGAIEADRIFQAKGMDYSLVDLLGGNASSAQLFTDGQFATIYLSPSDYHRVHIPYSAQLKTMMHVPGRLFSVNALTASAVPGLFARNERVVSLFDTALGSMAVIMVGAIIVASIKTQWAGVVTPPTRKGVHEWPYDEGSHTFIKGQEIGRFLLGSTVIVLFQKDRIDWADIKAGDTVRMGQLLGQVLQ